ncbi:MAG: hypothetical protein AB7K52_00195 [Phycisphaerales bacterium]
MAVVVVWGGAGAAPVLAQLREDQVLVVYDRRISDSVAVAEHYAGSLKVTGGTGSVRGARPGVRTLDLAERSPGLVRDTADVTPADFAAYLRGPIRAHLREHKIEHAVRCICLTKGLPHRIVDFDRGVIGDNPPAAQAEFLAGDYGSACVDAELALLWLDVEQGEGGLPGDSFADGLIANPFFLSTLGINAYSTRNLLMPKVLLAAEAPAGTVWRSVAGPASFRISPGDMYLVCRLDGNSVEAVRAMIDRSRSPRVNVDEAACLLDESNSNGSADAIENGELDNESIAGLRPAGDQGDDYEATANLLVKDGRFLAFPQTPAPGAGRGHVLYSRLTGMDEFFVGPRLSFGGRGRIVDLPVLLLASEGNNHGIIAAGFPVVPPGAGALYPRSFRYSPGAVMTSIESANGRNFHGLGGNFGQASISDFLEAGGCFAIGHVWEPFAFSLPRNVMLARNFVLGSMTWAEAAYTALPTLSFQSIVVGDPLARLTRSSEDLDGDGAATICDLVLWHGRPADLNRSGEADRDDARLIERDVRAGEVAGMAGRARRGR